MNPIEELRNATFTNKFKEEYLAAADRKSFLTSVFKGLGAAHYPCLKFNTDLNQERIQIENRTLYDQKLQDGLSNYEVEKNKMIVTVERLLNNYNHELSNQGGSVSVGLVLNNPVEAKDENGFRVIKDNPVAESNIISFRSLKGNSVYCSYIFGNIQNDNLRDVYSDLIDVFPTEINKVQTYTILYVVNDTTIREVTLHDFDKYGNILTKIDLKI